MEQMMDSLSWTHANHTITIGIGSHKMFVVTGPFVDGEFASYREATNKIDDAVHKHELTSRKRISVAVLTEKGERVTITGIHASNGSILGLPKADYNSYSERRFYPDVAWIADTIRQMRNLMRQADALRRKLVLFEVTTYEIRSLRTDDHGVRVDNLVAAIEEKRVAAEKAALSDERAVS